MSMQSGCTAGSDDGFGQHFGGSETASVVSEGFCFYPGQLDDTTDIQSVLS